MKYRSRSSLTYYNYIMNLVYRYKITECLPPYTDTVERRDGSKGAPPCPDLGEYWAAFDLDNRDYPLVI